MCEEETSSHMLFLLPSEVYPREEHGKVYRAALVGLTWVIHKNGHLSITLSYMLMLISPSHHSNGVLSSNKREALACGNCMYVLCMY